MKESLSFLWRCLAWNPGRLSTKMAKQGKWGMPPPTMLFKSRPRPNVVDD
jgi:hypothetical protein